MNKEGVVEGAGDDQSLMMLQSVAERGSLAYEYWPELGHKNKSY